jgi:predicted nucleic acid-binding protein
VIEYSRKQQASPAFSVSSGPEHQVLIETDILGEFLTSTESSSEPRFLRALRRYTCYTTMLNAYELLHAARNEEEQQHIYSALSLVRVLGFNSRNAVPFAALSQQIERDHGVQLSMRDAFVIGMAQQSKLSILTQNKHDLYTSAHTVPVIRDVATSIASRSVENELMNGSDNILSNVGIGEAK